MRNQIITISVLILALFLTSGISVKNYNDPVITVKKEHLHINDLSALLNNITNELDSEGFNIIFYSKNENYSFLEYWIPDELGTSEKEPELEDWMFEDFDYQEESPEIESWMFDVEYFEDDSPLEEWMFDTEYYM